MLFVVRNNSQFISSLKCNTNRITQHINPQLKQSILADQTHKLFDLLAAKCGFDTSIKSGNIEPFFTPKKNNPLNKNDRDMEVEYEEHDDDRVVPPMGPLNDEQRDEKDEGGDTEVDKKKEDWSAYVSKNIAENGWGSGDEDTIQIITQLTRSDPSRIGP
eukprot:571859_1